MYRSVIIPDGEYLGRWTDTWLTFTLDGKECYIQTQRRTRGINVPVRFIVENGRVKEAEIEWNASDTGPY